MCVLWSQTNKDTSKHTVLVSSCALQQLDRLSINSNEDIANDKI